ncbi:MAG: hypothetical protein CSA55_02115 [Ilumatobacter coccineus]|uniref:Uncharacterized protein n=1 Tax=Ilumatobacter coccineus TaxID=467094 RepID=A0A2G6KCE0_9ACTN|nr:MAG: hypothetical protein CSA55_02115 [Ilumatobacter coccineus]
MSLTLGMMGVAVAAVMMMAMMPVIDRVIDRQAATQAADAAALAGVIDGHAAAVDAAEHNGGELVAWEIDGAVVTVSVTVGSMTATARATDGP